MSRLRRMASNATVLIFGTVVAVALLEGGLRATGWLLVRSRAPARLAGPTPGVIRVLCIGESTTFGTGRTSQDTYPAQLERILNERSGGRRYTVFNDGLPATTTDRLVAGLQPELDNFRPHVVVAMMGINDGPFDDPLFPVTDSLRIVKLGRLLAAGAAHAFDCDDASAPQVAAIPWADGHPVSGIPPGTGQRLFVASLNVLKGRLDDAERMLAPLADIPTDDKGARIVAARAEGELAMVAAQRKRLDELAARRRRYRELVGPRLNPATATNYLTLVRLLAARGIPLVAVQYPAQNAQPLRDLLADHDNVVVVDNEETFIQASIEQPLGDVYVDLFAGIFGHMTAGGHRLLATNVADAVESIVGRGP